MSATSHRERRILEHGTVLGRFRILRLIGQGGYGDIYECQDLETDDHWAIKIEMTDLKKQALQREIEIMRLLDSPYFPKLVAYEETPEYRYLVMEMCGASFTAVRRLLPSHKFSISTVLRAGIEMLRAIEAFHTRGILHRDIKPSNFLIRASRRHPLVLTDYGLSRLYVDQTTGEMVPPRHDPGFVGTSKYASLNAHAGKELGRRDDLFSWFYSLIEMWAGHLPWPSTHDKRRMQRAKMTTDISREIQGMPKAMVNVYRLIRRMERDDEPDYQLLMSFMCEAMGECGANWDDKWEWEEIDVREISAIELKPPADERPNIPKDLPSPVMPPRAFVPIVLGKR